MKVSACLVTRGDVDMQPVLDSLPAEWEKIIYDNGNHRIDFYAPGERAFGVSVPDVPDLSVYGRYAAVSHARYDLIYVQDDDVIVSDPQAIVDALVATPVETFESGFRWPVVCNMPQEFRHEFYTDHALVGFGAAFHRDAPQRAFDKFYAELSQADLLSFTREDFHRTCDIVFTGLTPVVAVDVPRTNLDHAFADNRMYRQDTHIAERARMRELVRQVRDA